VREASNNQNQNQSRIHVFCHAIQSNQQANNSL
jgi:hypothetical protein